MADDEVTNRLLDLEQQDQLSVAARDIIARRRSVGEFPPPRSTSQFRAEPSGVRQLLREIPPLVGLLGGGLAGLPVLPPFGAIAGAGLGFAGGRQLTRAGESLEEVLRPPPAGIPPTFGQPFGTQALNIGRDILTGAALEMLPAPVLRGVQAAGRAGGRLLGLGAPTAEDLAVRAAAARQGLEMTAAAKSGAPGVALLESVPGRFPIGRQTAEPMFTRVRESGRRAAERLGAQLGPEVSLETAGKTIQAELGVLSRAQETAPTTLFDDFLGSLGTRRQGRLDFGGSLQEGLKAAQAARRTQATTLYDEALELGGRENPVPLTSLQEVSSRIVALERRLRGVESRTAGRAAKLQQTSGIPPLRAGDLPPEALRELTQTRPDLLALLEEGRGIAPQALPQEFIAAYQLETVGVRTLEETLSIQQRLKSLIRHTSDDFTRRQLRSLADAVTDDLAAFGRQAGGDFGRALDLASRFYKREVAELFAEKSTLRRLLNAAPGEAATKVLTTTSPDALTALMRGLPPRQQAELQRMVMEKVKERTLDPRTGEVSPLKLEDILTRFGEENLSILLGPRARDLAAVRQTISAGFGRGTQDPVFGQMLTGSAEHLVNALARGRIKSLDDFDAVWASLSPQGQHQMRSALYGDILKGSSDPVTGLFSQERFIRQKEQIPQAIWDRLVSTDFAGALQDIELVFRRNILLSRAAANPSATAMGLLGPGQVLGGMALAGSAALGREDPASFGLKALALFSPFLLGKMVFSKTGQRMLTSGPPPSLAPFGPASTIGKMFGAQLAPEDRPKE